MAALGRHNARASIDLASAAAIAQSPDKKSWKEWMRAKRIAAGW